MTATTQPLSLVCKKCSQTNKFLVLAIA